MSKLTRTAWGLEPPRVDQLWRQEANCTPAVAEWFWLTGPGGRGGRTYSADNKAAVALCRTCPVIGDCLAYEVAHPDPHPRIAAGRLWPQGRVL